MKTVRLTGREIPQVTLALADIREYLSQFLDGHRAYRIADVVLTLWCYGADLHRSRENVGPLRSGMPVQLSDGARFETHVNASQVWG